MAPAKPDSRSALRSSSKWPRSLRLAGVNSRRCVCPGASRAVPGDRSAGFRSRPENNAFLLIKARFLLEGGSFFLSTFLFREKVARPIIYYLNITVGKCPTTAQNAFGFATASGTQSSLCRVGCPGTCAESLALWAPIAQGHSYPGNSSTHNLAFDSP